MTNAITDIDHAAAQARAVAGAGPAFLPPFAHSRLGSMGIELELMVLDRLTYDLLPAAPDILLLLDKQDKAWRTSVLPAGLPRVAVEAGVTAFWYKYVGLEGAVVGIDRFGESAPAGDLFKFFGLTADKVAAAVKQVL